MWEWGKGVLQPRKPYPFEAMKDFGDGGKRFVPEQGNVTCFGITCECDVAHEYQRNTGTTSAGITAQVFIPPVLVEPHIISNLIDEPGSELQKKLARQHGFTIAAGIEKRIAPKKILAVVADPEERGASWYFDIFGKLDIHSVLYTFRPHGRRGRRTPRRAPATGPAGVRPELEDA